MRSLRSKLIVLIAVMFMSAGLLLTGVIYIQMRSKVQEGLNATLGATAVGQADVIHDWLTDHSRIIDAATRVAGEADPRPMLAHLNAAGGFDLTYIGYADKRMLYSDGRPQPNGYDPTARPWYKLAQQEGKSSLSEPYVDFDTHKLVVTFATPVMKDGALQGVAGADVFIDGLVKSVLSLKLPAQGYAFLVNRDGKVIAHPDQALTLKSISERLPELTASQIAQMAGTSEMGALGDGKYFGRLVPIAGTSWYLGIVVDRAEVMQPVNQLLYTLFGGAVLVLLVLVPMLSLVIGRMLKGLGGLRDAMREIARGEGDLTRRMPVNGADEIAETANAFNQFIEQLHAMFRSVHVEAGRVTDGVDQVGQRVSTVVEDSRQISDVSSSNAATLEQITTSIAHIAETARDTDDLVMRTGQITGNSADAMERISHEMRRTMQAVQDLSSMLSSLDGRSEQISGITNVIKDIAEQTNLLALNAAIEAARAGEQGRGFAVVADEVRKLAERTAQATVEITGMVGAIREETRQAVSNMQQTLTSVEGGAELTQEAVGHIGQIRQAMQEVMEKMNVISLSTREQHNATTQIAQSTERINGRIVDSDTLLQDAQGTLKALAEVVGSLQASFARFKL